MAALSLMNSPYAWSRSVGAVGLAWGVGDVICQQVEQPAAWDRVRTLQFVSVGTLVMGPTSHGFELLNERLFPGNAMREVAKKVLFRVCCAPGFLTLSFGGLALVRGHDVLDAVTNNVWPAWCAGTLFWPAVSCFTYKFVPVATRPAFGSTVGALWSSYLSYIAHRGAKEPPSVSSSITTQA